MSYSNKFLLSLSLIALTSCAPGTISPRITDEAAMKEAELQREIAVKEITKNRQKLQDVGRPILTANVEMCGNDVAPYTGAIYESESTIGRDYKQTYKNLYGVSEKPTVVILAKSAPASNKLKTGDVILAVNGTKIPDGNWGHKKIKSIQDELQEGESLTFTVDRNGQTMDVDVKPVLACDYLIELQQADIVNAFADGSNIFVTSGMIRFVENNEELALVLGHEMAHNTANHMGAKTGNAVIGGILGAVVTVATGVDVTNLGSQLGASAFSQGFESEADYIGLYHTARAGYAVDKAPTLWRRMGASNPAAIHLTGTTHPSTAKRFLSLEEASKEVAKKKTSGKKLLPEQQVANADYQSDKKPGELNN